ELAAAAGPIEEPPAPVRPSLGTRIRGALSGAASRLGEAAGGVKRWFGQKFSRENRRDIGARGQAVAGMGAPVPGHASEALRVAQHVVDNPVTAGAADYLAPVGAVGKLHQAGESVGGVSSAAQSTTGTLEHPGDFAHSFTAGGFELVHM